MDVTQTQDLLIEIGTEELPPTALQRLSEAFTAGMVKEFEAARLSFDEIQAFATPRRLALVVPGLSLRQADQQVARRGPALTAAFDESGLPTRAALGFAGSCGVSVDELSREETDKGAWLSFRHVVRGEETAKLLPAMIERALALLPIPKRMRWGAGEAEFVRPLHWVCAILGETPVEGEVLGVAMGRETRGHRFHHPETLAIARPRDYVRLLRSAKVEPDFVRRRTLIRDQVEALAHSIGGKASIPEDLLDEVTALCEWPVALLGSFDPQFLEVPPEVLIETMQSNQKYFSVFDPQGALLPSFITISNIDSRAPELVRAGNERVIRPRFSDAMFFWEQDLKIRLEARQERLASIVFQHKLGSLWDKSQRVSALAREIAETLGEDAALAERAALLGKCDLVTLMVGEFPSLQGTMGRYYAARDAEDPCVVAAMEEQYLPRHAGDALPESPCGRALALADKLDSLIGIFAIGERPTGVKDPYGLRRAAIGVLRILIETPLALDLKTLLASAARGFPDAISADMVVEEVMEYLNDRLPGYYADVQINGDNVEAVLAVGVTQPSDLDRRVHAVADFRGLDAAEALAAANKRIRNILKKSAAEEAEARLDASLLQEPAERALAEAIEVMRIEVAPLQAKQDYAGMLRILSGLREPVDRFFDEVMVMAEDAALRTNRVALLRELEQLFLAIADFSRLQVAS